MGRGRNTQRRGSSTGRDRERSEQGLEQTHGSGCPHQSHRRSRLPRHTPRAWRCSGGCCTQTARGSRTCLGEEERRGQSQGDVGGRTWQQSTARLGQMGSRAGAQGGAGATAHPDLAVPTCHADGHCSCRAGVGFPALELGRFPSSSALFGFCSGRLELKA